MKTYKVGIIGAGLQAKRRIPPINQHPHSKVVAITSKSLESAKYLGKKHGIKVYDDWKKIIEEKEIDIIVIATYPDIHSEISIEASERKKHILCEKPLAISIQESEKMIQAAQKNKILLHCGFNHRYHPAIIDAKKLVVEKKLGKLLFGRGIYGYCGRPGFENEWRSNPKHVVGGILMEQGIHLIDLFRYFFGNFKNVTSFINRLYFPIGLFEDNAFLILKTKKNQAVSIHSTILQWKNTFEFEIYGTQGYIKVEGLGSSYGTEKLVYGKKDYSAPFTEKIIEYRGDDKSWMYEWNDFMNAVEKNTHTVVAATDGLEAIRIVLASYKSSQSGKVITI